MYFANVLKKPIYVCSYYTNDDGIAQYLPPVKYEVNCFNTNPASARADVAQIGSSYSEYKQIVGDSKYLAKIKELDVVYVDVEPPITHNALAKTADYVVQGAPARLPVSTKIMLKRLTVDPQRI